ncbi:MAG: ribonuclease III [Isosphaeraceae bacterium]
MSSAGSIDDSAALAVCQARIGYQFHDVALLRAALTHASGANHRLGSNERLEFLGDSILGAIVCDLLYRRCPDFLEGELTRIKSVVVSRRTCAKLSKRLGIGEFLVLGKGMGSPLETPASVHADVFESLVGAIYLDGGMKAARRFISRHLLPEIEATLEGEGTSNYKSMLQQLAQREFGATPVYLLVDEKGPDHLKCFQISAQIGGRQYAPAWGSNKKDAEQRAAMNALSQLAGEGEKRDPEPAY